MNNYANIIGSATNAYNATIAGYQKVLQQQQQAQAGVMQGYNDLQAGVLGGLEQSSAVAGKTISDQYKQDAAKQQMMLYKQGLGNSTTVNNLLSQLGKNQAFAQEKRLADFATTAADKRTQLGLAGLGYAGNALNTNLGFAGQGLQYSGTGALQLGHLAEGFAGLENQQEMQKQQFAQQLKLQKLQQSYGVGTGHIGSYDGGGGHPAAGHYGGGSINASPYPAVNYVGNPAYTAANQSNYSSSGGDFGEEVAPYGYAWDETGDLGG